MSAESPVTLDQWRARARYIDVDGLRGAYWESGEGEPVLCFHGVPASAYLYRKLLPALAAHGLRGIAFDLPGLGLSDRPESFDYSWTGLSAWAERFADALGLGRCHFVVHDIGGPVGFDVIRRRPARVASLTVLNTVVDVSRFTPPWVMRPFRWAGVGEAYLATITPVTLSVLMRTHGVLKGLSRVEAQTYVQLLKGDDGGRAFLCIMRGFELTDAFESRIVAPLRARTFPAQVLWGAQDPALPMNRYAPQIAKLLGLAEARPLAGKHFVQEDSAGEIAEAVRSLAAGAPC
jgi:pimeloyl-ACP methyl ester carboxylesterase